MDRYTESKITRYRTDLKESLATTLQVNIWIDIQRASLHFFVLNINMDEKYKFKGI